MSNRNHDIQIANEQSGTIVAVNISAAKGTRKDNVRSAEILKDFGIRNDAHGGPWHRQVSLLALESIRKMQTRGLAVTSGDFAENLTTEGLDLVHLPVGTRLRIGRSAVIEVTQIGKKCHLRCAVYDQTGTCIMPTDGIFAKVLSGGPVAVGDTIAVMEKDQRDRPDAPKN